MDLTDKEQLRQRLDEHESGNLEVCDFGAMVRSEIGIIRGVSSTLEDLHLTCENPDYDDVIRVQITSLEMLSDVARRAVDDLEEKLEVASQWFRDTKLIDAVSAYVDKKPNGSGIPLVDPQKGKGSKAS